jgi:hypothetical protein
MAAGSQPNIPDLTQQRFYAEYQTPQQCLALAMTELCAGINNHTSEQMAKNHNMTGRSMLKRKQFSFTCNNKQASYFTNKCSSVCYAICKEGILQYKWLIQALFTV